MNGSVDTYFTTAQETEASEGVVRLGFERGRKCCCIGKWKNWENTRRRRSSSRSKLRSSALHFLTAWPLARTLVVEDIALHSGSFRLFFNLGEHHSIPSTNRWTATTSCLSCSLIEFARLSYAITKRVRF